MKINRRDFLGVAGLGVSSAFATLPVLAEETDQRSRIGHLSWPDWQALPRFETPHELQVADATSLTGDQQLVLTTLQGIVNRRRPEIYLLLQGDGTDQTWLAELDARKTTVSDPLSLVNKYRQRINGAIVYDPVVPDTINVATSLAGLEDAVVASPDLAAEYQLPIVRDLRGQFADKFTAYNWLLDKYWDRLDHRLLVGLVPGNGSLKAGVPWTTLLQVTQPVTDASNRGTYSADLSSFLGKGPIYVRFSDAYPNDGWGPSVGQVTLLADGQTIASFQPGTAAEESFLYEPDGSQLGSAWRFADGTNFFIYRFAPATGTTTLTLQVTMWNEYSVSATTVPPVVYTPFPNLRDYAVATRALTFSLDPLEPSEASLFTQIVQKVKPNTPYLGWFPLGHEDSGVSLCAAQGVRVVAADYWNNGTVWAGANAPIATHQPSAPATTLANKVYLTLTMSEGDNLQYCEHRLRSLWDDPGRGKTPLNWSITPLLLDAAPPMLHYIQRTQTANDFLVAGPSGAGYTYPGLWPAADLALFTKQTGQYMARTGLDVIYALNRSNDTNIDLTPAVAQQYEKNVRLLGVLSNWINVSQLSTPAGLLVYTQVGISSVSDGQSALSAAIANWDGNSPLFVALGVLAWNMTPTDVNTLASTLSSEYEVVRADVFFELLASSRSGK